MRKETFYSMGRCSGCGGEVVRRCDYRGDSGRTLTRVCSCAPRLEAFRAIVRGDDGRMVVWNEEDGA